MHHTNKGENTRSLSTTTNEQIAFTGTSIALAEVPTDCQNNKPAGHLTF
ncbi:hypothetical protein [Alkalinema sp. FACHB-956]|nr:hypothetical protein [Alkalinema sp. FACHB-956]MBD2325695.1 hypothetical protein [Alkalinema sp. FACHB-956]